VSWKKARRLERTSYLVRGDSRPLLRRRGTAHDGVGLEGISWAIHETLYVTPDTLTGPHNHTGNVFEPRALDELIPDWREKGAPIDTPVTEDAFLILYDDKKSVRLPNALLPPQQVCYKGKEAMGRVNMEKSTIIQV